MLWMRVGLLGAAGWVAAAQVGAGYNFNQQGVDADARGDHAAALQAYEQAVQAWRKAGPDFDACLATTMTNIGRSLYAEGRRRESAAAFEEGLARARKSLGVEHLLTLGTMDYLAQVRLRLGDGDGAGILYRESLLHLRASHPADIETARALAGLASVHLWQGDPAGAGLLAEDALTIALRADGEKTADTALMYAAVAETHRALGRLERALPLYRKAIAIFERTLGPDDRLTAQARGQEALILMSEGKFSLAEREMRETAESLAKSCAQCWMERSTAEHNLGLVLLREGRYEESDRLLTHALALQEQNAERPGREMADTLQTLADLRRKERRPEDADRFASRAAAIERTDPPAASLR